MTPTLGFRGHGLIPEGPLATTFAASIATQGLNVLTGILLARSLGPDGRGYLAALILWPVLVAAAGSLSLSDAVTFACARGRHSPRTITGTALAAWLVQSMVLVAIGAGVIRAVFADYPARIEETGYLMLAIVPLYLLTAYGTALLQGLSSLRPFNVLRVLVPFTTGVILVGLALTERLDVRPAALAYVATYFFTALAAVYALARGDALPSRVDRDLLRELLSFGLRSHTSFVTTTLNERLDQLVISLFLAPASLGLYVVAVTLSSATMLVGSTVSLVALPQAARLTPGQARTDAVRRLVQLTFATSATVTVPLVIVTPFLLRVLFGPSFEPVANVARILLVAAVLFATGRVLSALLKGLGRPLDAGFADAMAACVTVGSLVLLLPGFGLTGAAISSLLTYGVSAAWLARRVGVSLGESARTLLLSSPRRHECDRLAGVGAVVSADDR